METLKSKNMFPYLDEQDKLICEAMETSQANLHIRFGPAIELVADLLAKDNYKAEDLTPWPVFRDLLIKRRCFES